MDSLRCFHRPGCLEVILDASQLLAHVPESLCVCVVVGLIVGFLTFGRPSHIRKATGTVVRATLDIGGSGDVQQGERSLLGWLCEDCVCDSYQSVSEWRTRLLGATGGSKLLAL